MFETLALLGGFWFFLLIVIVFAAGALSCEYDSITGGIFTILLLIGGLQLLGYPIFSTIISSPFVIFLLLFGYIAAGAAYAIIYRYPTFLGKNKSNIEKAYNSWEHEGAKSPFETSHHFREFSPGYNVDRITSWVMLWPWGMLWSLSHRPFIWVYDTVYVWIGKVLDSVAKRFIRNNITK